MRIKPHPLAIVELIYLKSFFKFAYKNTSGATISHRINTPNSLFGLLYQAILLGNDMSRSTLLLYEFRDNTAIVSAVFPNALPIDGMLFCLEFVEKDHP